MLNELALFAGAGGGLLGSLLLEWRVICAVEIDPYRREVLLRRQRDGVLAMFPVWDDVRTFDGKPWRGIVDVVTAGFPCQPFSVAGKRKGADDERNVWPDTIRVIREVGPSLVFLENSPALRCPDLRKTAIQNPSYYGRVLGDLAESGFACRWDCIPATSVGANHQRDRLWIVAYAEGVGEVRLPVRPGGSRQAAADVAGDGEEVSDADMPGQPDVQGQCATTGSSRSGEPGTDGWWNTEPDVGRVADGVAHRVDCVKALGNGQVPAVVVRAWEELMGEPPSFPPRGDGRRNAEAG